MWEDFKKLGGLLVEQTIEQKEIALLRLREMSYKNKREDAMARLGQATHNAINANEAVNKESATINQILNEIEEIDKEIGLISTLVVDLKQQAATERVEMADGVEGVWEKTKTAFYNEQNKQDEKPKEKQTKKQDEKQTETAEEKTTAKDDDGKA